MKGDLSMNGIRIPDDVTREEALRIGAYYGTHPEMDEGVMQTLIDCGYFREVAT